MAFFGGSPGGGELLIIFVVVLVLFGAKNLPEIARTIGKTLESLRRAARDVSDEIMRTDTPAPRPRELPAKQTTEGNGETTDREPPAGIVPGLHPAEPRDEAGDGGDAEKGAMS
ncbi:MAG: twin-arginine translocase TatA/TatE family subunit [Verrucomicrobia bacterium]|nr:twin-arginine translocase TatA/TatE family subunit [Verrucomicrobiota bacterium]